MLALMLRVTMLASALSAADPAQPRSAGSCMDPASSLEQLALQYDRWPSPRNGVAVKGFELLKKAMQTHREADYGVALNKYRNVGGNVMRSTDPHERLAIGILNLTSRAFTFDNTNYYQRSRSLYNTNAERVAGEQLVALVESDPRQWLAAVAVALTRLAILSRGEQRYLDARAALARVLDADPNNVTAHLAWRDLLVAQDSLKEADAYLRAHPADCVPFKHAQAETMILVGDTAAGSALYLAALEGAAPDQLDRYHQDLLLMADREQLKQWDSTAPAERAKWIRTFWERNAAAYARTIETRVVEQITRVAYADRHFKRDRVQTAAVASKHEFVEDSSQALPWDLRGVMYVRHGPPLHRLRQSNECAGYEAWVYVTDSQPWILSFTRGCDRFGPHDWALQQTPICNQSFLGVQAGPPGPVAIRRAIERPDAMNVREIYETLARFDSRYAELAQSCVSAMAGARATELRLQQLQRELPRDQRALVQHVQWGGTAHRQFLYRLQLDAAAYQFRGADARPEMNVIAWVPASELGTLPAPLQGDPVTRLRLNYALLESAGAPRREATTIDVPSDASGLVRAATVMRDVHPGTMDLHVVVIAENDTARGDARTLRLSVRPPANGLDMSDIVLAVPDAVGPMVRGSTRIAPLPAHAIGVGGTARVYFEVYGLAAGDDFTQTIHVIRTSKEGVRELLNLFPGKQDERTVSIRDVARADAGRPVTRDLEFGGDLVPGDYRMTVTISARGQTVRRETTLRVVRPD